MSQSGTYFKPTVIPPGTYVETLTGNSGGAVSSDGSSNINTVGAGNITIVGNPGTHTLTTELTGITQHSLQVGGAANALTQLGVATNGQLPIGSTGADPVLATLTAGSGISITNAAGSITIANTGSSTEVATLHTQDGNNVTPTAGVINISGGNSLTTTGTVGPNTATISLTGITQYNVQTGGASNALNNVAPGATSGVPLISQGAASQPIFGTALVAGGGTGSTSFNTTGVVISGATSTTALTAVTLTDGQLAIGSSIGNPAAATLTAGTGIAITNSHNSITIAATGTTNLNYTNVNTTPYVVLTTDDYLSVDCSGGAITVELPNAATSGRVYTIKDRTGSAATHNITVQSVSGAVNIDGATTFVMNTNYESINIMGNGSTYEVY